MRDNRDVKLPGLRERKKQQTRLAISDVATHLFMERGFDQVTVAEVAAAANVSVNTIFNYFATKEELFFDRGEEVADEPSRIVRGREPGESAIDAIRRVYVTTIKAHSGFFEARVKPFVATIEASPALKLRERVIYDLGEQRLVQTLIAETGATPTDPTPRVVAALIIGLQWMLIQEFRTRLLRGEPQAKISAALVRTAERGFDLLSAGIANYARRPKTAKATTAATLASTKAAKAAKTAKAAPVATFAATKKPAKAATAKSARRRRI